MKYKNNPFNLRHSRMYKRPGEDRSMYGYCTFVSEYFGIRAAVNTIFFSFRTFGFVCIKDIVEHFTPISIPLKDDYIEKVTAKTKIPPLKFLSDKMEYALVLKAISEINGNGVFLDSILQVLDDMEVEKALKAACNQF